MTYQNSAQLLRKYSDMIKEMQHPVVESDEEDESKEEVDEAKDVDESEEQVEEGKLPPALQAHIDAKKDKEVDKSKDEEEVGESKDSPVRKLKEHDTIQRMQYLAGMNA